jgi:hypothetical protein
MGTYEHSFPRTPEHEDRPKYTYIQISGIAYVFDNKREKNSKI